MLPDPVTVAAAAPTPSLVLTIVKQDGYGSERTDTGGNGYTVVTNHSKPKGGGDRHYVQMTQTLNATNPYTGATQKVTASASIAISRPSFGFTDAALTALVVALRDYVWDTEVTPAKLIQFQS